MRQDIVLRKDENKKMEMEEERATKLTSSDGKRHGFTTILNSTMGGGVVLCWRIYIIKSLITIYRQVFE